MQLNNVAQGKTADISDGFLLKQKCNATAANAGLLSSVPDEKRSFHQENHPKSPRSNNPVKAEIEVKNLLTLDRKLAGASAFPMESGKRIATLSVRTCAVIGGYAKNPNHKPRNQTPLE